MDRLAWMPALLAAAFFTFVSLEVYFSTPGAHSPGSDGLYSWFFARSLAFDGDLSFANDYAQCGDPFAIGFTTDSGHAANIFYPGPALLWTPLIAALRLFVTDAMPAAERAGCVGFIPTIVLATSSLLGGLLVLVTARILARWFSARVAALAALTATIGGLVLRYTAAAPSYSHVHDALAVALLVLFTLRARERAAPLRSCVAVGVFLGLAILQRASNGIFALVPIVVLLGRRDLRLPVRGAAIAVVLAGAGLVGVLPLVATYRVVFGHYLFFTHGRHFMHWGHAHPLLLLFDPRTGLFFSAPWIWLAVLGLPALVARRDTRPLVASFLVVALVELYVASAATDWQAARRLLNWTPLFALGIAVVFERVARFMRRRRRRAELALAAAFAAVVAWHSGSITYALGHNFISWDEPSTAATLEGESQKQTLSRIESQWGNPSIYPAELVFSARYGLPMRAFGWAATPNGYMRDPFHDLKYIYDDIGFPAAGERGLLRGFASRGGAVVVSAPRASIVFGAQWPVATRASLFVDATHRARIGLRSRSFLGHVDTWGSGVVDAGPNRELVVPIPAGAFDSGVNEVLFDVDPADVGNLRFVRLTFLDENAYPPAW